MAAHGEGNSVTTVNVHEAKTRLSQLLEMVEAGEEVVIARAGKPVARLSRVKAGRRRQPGSARGLVTIHESFDDPLPEFEDYQ
ncbi:MAG TPA: type II toxin-antitoxin system Phd/YefM family antitoxin [Deinococcales bacterium]|nr:type II toxin-antitoxin system Phd/YefM family antitoxin [Deinococcales bacterium]